MDALSVSTTLIALVSIAGSFAMIIGMTLYEVVGVTPFTYLLIAIGSVLDVLLDSICVALSLNVYDGQYRTVCRRCDSGLKWCCVKLTDRATRKKEMELAEMHRHQTAAEQENTDSDHQTATPRDRSAETQLPDVYSTGDLASTVSTRTISSTKDQSASVSNRQVSKGTQDL